MLVGESNVTPSMASKTGIVADLLYDLRSQTIATLSLPAESNVQPSEAMDSAVAALKWPCDKEPTSFIGRDAHDFHEAV